MPKVHWKERFGKGGVCDFSQNYNFFFKWLLSKTASCFYIEGLPKTIDEYYLKSNLLIDGEICITEFNEKLYAVQGSPGGKPDEYYRPTVYTVANPVLGSKTVNDGIDGIIIYNAPIDAYIPGGLYGLITQTATLLADNIVSINCTQINARVTAIVSADSKSQQIEAENTMQSIYAGKPFKVLRSDILEKIKINPIATANTSSNITELVELNNYIISNYFQSIGIRANNLRKKSHMLQDEIDVQNNFLQISIYEIITSWQKGLDRVNEMYGTDIKVHINPALLTEFEESAPEPEESAPELEPEESAPEPEFEESAPESAPEPEPEESAPEPEESAPEIIREKEKQLTEIVDIINDKKEGEGDAPDNKG